MNFATKYVYKAQINLSKIYGLCGKNFLKKLYNDIISDTIIIRGVLFQESKKLHFSAVIKKIIHLFRGGKKNSKRNLVKHQRKEAPYKGIPQSS